MVTDGRWLSQTRTHPLQRGHARTNLIPNKHHEVIMSNLSIALFSCSAWLSRPCGVEMQTQAPTVWRHSAIIIPQTVPYNRPWQMVISTAWTSLENEQFVLPDTWDSTLNFCAEKVSWDPNPSLHPASEPKATLPAAEQPHWSSWRLNALLKGTSFVVIDKGKRNTLVMATRWVQGLHMQPLV